MKLKFFFWFILGGFLGLFLLVSFAFIIFQKKYEKVIYPGVMIQNIDFGGKSQEEVKNFFAKKNAMIADTNFIFQYENITAIVSAEQLNYGYNDTLLAQQAYGIGRGSDIFSNASLIFQSYISGINLEPSYHYLEDALDRQLLPISEKAYVAPVDALFTFQNGRVAAFRLSSDGQKANIEFVKNDLRQKIVPILTAGKPQTITESVPLQTLKPNITTDKANSLGIKELIASGTSVFAGSAPSRTYNVVLAAKRMSGALLALQEIFSFDKTLGDISSFTGYKQSLIIQNGRTVLGDGGGVCQVSTTLFRAVLNAGLPIVERHPHAFRVQYYELDSAPGLDATIYIPSVDLKFKNDTNNYILIQTDIDEDAKRLTFLLYGTKDPRMVRLTKPVITSQTPPPPPLYQDDATLPKGVEKQVEHEAYGAHVVFKREIAKNGKTLLAETFVSDFSPWRAVYLRGTKEQ